MERRFGDIAKTQYGLSEKMNGDRLGYKIFRMGEVQGGRLIDTGEMQYADITQEEFRKYKLRSGDVLFNRTNSYELVGKTGIFDIAGDYCFASYLVKLEADRNAVTPEFLNYFMNSSVFQESVKQKASRSINQANINAKILSNEPIFLPRTVSDQVAIVRKLDDLSSLTQRLQGIYQAKLAFLAGLKQAILQKAFAGELTAHPEHTLPEAAE
jgi:type I restriction enzyme M protein